MEEDESIGKLSSSPPLYQIRLTQGISRQLDLSSFILFYIIV